jgi:hypothetical protein
MAIEMLQYQRGILAPTFDPYVHFMLRSGESQNEDETLEKRIAVRLGSFASLVSSWPALKYWWPQMAASHKEKSPPEQRSPRQACSPRFKTQNSK